MARGRPLTPLILTTTERETLESWMRRHTTAQALAQRAGIVLACAAGKANRTVAREQRVDEDTVGKWRQRFLVKRLDGLLDEPRPGAPRTIGDAQVEHVVTLTLETTPRDATHWSTRAMAARCGLSQSTVTRIWETPPPVSKADEGVGRIVQNPGRACYLHPERAGRSRR